MSTDTGTAAPAAADTEHAVEAAYADHARDVLLGPGADGPLPGPAADPSLFGGAADDRALGLAARRLPPQERLVVRMRLGGHASARTIAAALRLPEARVARLLARGLARIRGDLLT